MLENFCHYTKRYSLLNHDHFRAYAGVLSPPKKQMLSWKVLYIFHKIYRFLVTLLEILKKKVLAWIFDTLYHKEFNWYELKMELLNLRNYNWNSRDITKLFRIESEIYVVLIGGIRNSFWTHFVSDQVTTKLTFPCKMFKKWQKNKQFGYQPPHPCLSLISFNTYQLL